MSSDASKRMYRYQPSFRYGIWDSCVKVSYRHVIPPVAGKPNYRVSSETVYMTAVKKKTGSSFWFLGVNCKCVGAHCMDEEQLTPVGAWTCGRFPDFETSYYRRYISLQLIDVKIYDFILCSRMIHNPNRKALLSITIRTRSLNSIPLVSLQSVHPLTRYIDIVPWLVFEAVQTTG